MDEMIVLEALNDSQTYIDNISKAFLQSADYFDDNNNIDGFRALLNATQDLDQFAQMLNSIENIIQPEQNIEPNVFRQGLISVLGSDEWGQAIVDAKAEIFSSLIRDNLIPVLNTWNVARDELINDINKRRS